MKVTYMRPAIAMIELIFALVIMGIVMMSAPMLITTASKSSHISIQQEGINEVASHINIIMDYRWDENNTFDNLKPLILSGATSNATLNNIPDPVTNVPTGMRAGTPNSTNRRFSVSGTPARGMASPSQLGGELDLSRDDIDDFHESNISLTLAQTGGSADYIETTTIALFTTVVYMSDNEQNGTYFNPGANNSLRFDVNTSQSGIRTNIKRIQVSLTTSQDDEELDKRITMHAFSSNIGSYKLEERH